MKIIEQKSPYCTKEIPVVFTPDENYVIPTCVAILSMLQTKKRSTKYLFCIIISEKFDKTCLHYFDRLKEIENGFNYQIIIINSDCFDHQKITTRHLSTSAYYRLILADILIDYEKCMYHDGDILVNKDLSEMYQIKMGNNYVAGIKAILMHQNTEQNMKRMQEWKFPSFDNYIFSGDLIFNLSKIRDDNLGEVLLKEMEKGYPSEDQDVINLCCYGNILFLPLKYCMLNRWINNDALITMENQVYSNEEINEAKQQPAIIHFAGANVKPWNNLRTECADKWWRYAKELLNVREYSEWYKKAEKETVRRDWSYLRKQIGSHRTVGIFGYSKISQNLYDTLTYWGIQVECFVDNDVNKQGEVYRGCEVLSLENALVRLKDVVIINSSQRFRKEINKQLKYVGVPEESCIDYYAKNEIYYMALAPEYYEYEYKDAYISGKLW